ncbi:MAG: choice-of-anchor J domain-containing protein [Saprospiraceae bacterium]|nr:choice-of-anchor J domain-containing protein [Saprospiraceae bacterium]
MHSHASFCDFTYIYRGPAGTYTSNAFNHTDGAGYSATVWVGSTTNVVGTIGNRCVYPNVTPAPIGPFYNCDAQSDVPLNVTATQTAGTTNQTIVLSEGFDALPAGNSITPAGWATDNNSTTTGSTGWFNGNGTVFGPQSGPGYIGANFNNTTGTNTINNWLITPVVTLQNGYTFSFYTRTVNSPSFPDRLQVRMSSNGASNNVGNTATSVGDFTTLLLDINPTLTTSGYPNTWTQYTVNVSGLAAPVTGRFAFRYFVTQGGPSGSNSDYIGIDNVVYASVTVGPTITWSGPGVTGSTFSPSSLAPGNYCLTVTYDATNDASVGANNGSAFAMPGCIQPAQLCVTVLDPNTNLTCNDHVNFSLDENCSGQAFADYVLEGTYNPLKDPFSGLYLRQKLANQ